MHHILVVGKKFSGLTNRIVSNGDQYTVLQDRTATKFPDKKLKNRVVANFSSTKELLATVDALHAAHPIDAVISVYENYILPTAIIGEHLGLPHLPISAAEACTDKFLMRQLFTHASEKISPDFAVISNEDDLRAFAATHTFPLILKPANLAKSLLVTKSDSLEQLLLNYKKTTELIDDIYKRYAPNRTPKILIEEFLSGSIHSVDAFVDSSGTPNVLNEIVDYQTGHEIGYDDNFHYSRIQPSKLRSEEQAALRHCAEVGVRALGIKNSPAHVEIIMTGNGPRIVEIGARNGGYRERMHALANDIDITGAAIALALGQQPAIAATKDTPIAVLELFPKVPGVFARINNESALRALPSLNYLSIKAAPGDYIGKAADGYKMAAVVILHSDDSEQFEQDLVYVNQHCYVVTE